MINLVDGKNHIVVKRDGSTEVYDENKMRKVLSWAITKAQEEFFNNVDENLTIAMINEVLKDTQVRIYDKISINKLFDEVIKTCENKISRLQPIWDKVTKNLLVQKYYKELWGVKRNIYPKYSEVVKKGKQYNVAPYLDIYENFTEKEIEELGNYIKAERDFNFTSLGIKSFMNRYALKYTKTKLFELPQHTYMRLAIKPFIKEDKEIRLNLIKKRYDHLSQSYFSEATPRFNDSNMEASCVLMKMGDDSYSITRTVQSVGLYSKYGGGTAVDVSEIRAIGSKIAVSGESDGVIPFIKMIESAISGFKQSSNKRRGACAVYFNWWHYEVEDLIMLKDEGGNEDKRARHLQFGIKINSMFLNRIINDEEVTLFDPKETPELLESFGEEFEEWYLYYEKKSGIRKKKIKARRLAYLLAKVRLETGNLYIFLDENVNENKPFKDYISQSNLCVAPETKILTDKGYQTISELKDQWVKVWNGQYFEEAYVAKTNDNAKLIKIETTGGTIECTPYHKFYLENEIEVRAGDLKVGDKLLNWKDTQGNLIKDYVIAIIDENRYDETYCFNAPETHKGVFNGILTGNCSEIQLPTKPSYLKEEHIVQKDFSEKVEIKSTIVNGEIALCNLSSINIAEWFNLSEKEKNDVAYLLLRSHDNLIDLAFYPVKEGEIHNKFYRPIGLGITNLAYFMAKNKVKMSSEEALKLQFNIMEDIYYYFYSNAVKLAQERGKFTRFNQSKWKDGWLPIDMNYELFLNYANKQQYDRWEKLRTDIKKYGIRFSTIGAIAPTATSALVMKNGSTESINSPKALIAQKSGGVNGYQLAPEFWKYGEWYELQYEISNKQLLKLAQIRQLFLDQAQSVDLFYTKQSAFEVIEDIIVADRLGVKTLYYANSKKAEDREVCESCSS